MPDAAILASPKRTYRGEITDPARWSIYTARAGDVMVCTPAKCGTTWTQTILVRLLAGGDLPGPVPEVSPWIDSNMRDADEKKRALAAQTGRRVVKTHTPGDGFPVWEGVPVVAVYRHPLDVFLSIRKHIHNMAGRGDHPLKAPMGEALEFYLTNPFQDDDVDRDSVDTLVSHYRRTVDTLRGRDLTVLHYADMMADRAGAVARLAQAAGITPDAEVMAAVTEATGFEAMKARATEYAPGGGTGLWQSDTDFFAKGGTGNWAGVLSDAQVARYQARMAELVPEPALRLWLEQGGPHPG
ncbi:MAG: sulfotransferase domain-containing protein [Pseudomonadota bacterium]